MELGEMLALVVDTYLDEVFNEDTLDEMWDDVEDNLEDGYKLMEIIPDLGMISFRIRKPKMDVKRINISGNFVNPMV